MATVATKNGITYCFNDVDPTCNEGSVTAWVGDPNKDAVATHVGRMTFGYPMRERERSFEVVAGWLIVDPAYRRRGIGTELWRMFLDWANARSFYAEYTPEGRKFIDAVYRRSGGTR